MFAGMLFTYNRTTGGFIAFTAIFPPPEKLLAHHDVIKILTNSTIITIVVPADSPQA